MDGNKSVAMKVRITSLGGMLSVACRVALSSLGVSMRIDIDVGQMRDSDNMPYGMDTFPESPSCWSIRQTRQIIANSQVHPVNCIFIVANRA